MFEFIDFPDDRIIGLKVSGKLSHQDYVDVCVPAIEAALKKHKKIRLYVELQDFGGWDWKAAWDDLKISFQHRHDFERLAIVGHHGWEEWALELFGLMMSGKAAYYTEEQKTAAKTWIQAESV